MNYEQWVTKNQESQTVICMFGVGGGIDAFKNLWSQPAVAAIFPSGRIEMPDMPGRSKLISFFTIHVPYSQHDIYKKYGVYCGFGDNLVYMEREE